MQLLLLVCVMEVLEYHIYLTCAPGVLLFAKNSLNSAAHKRESTLLLYQF